MLTFFLSKSFFDHFFTVLTFFRISKEAGVVQVYLDEERVGYDLEQESTHDFLDPYLAKITFGGKRDFEDKGIMSGIILKLDLNNNEKISFTDLKHYL